MPITRAFLLAFLLLPRPLASQALRDSAVVSSDGATLFLELRAADSTRPVVLFLHGGPGDPFSALLPFMAYPGPALEREFVMAYLYERGVGKSGPVPIQSHTIAQYIRDVDQAVDYLRRRFRTARVAIIGHSFGGALGTAYMLDHGEKVSRLVNVCGPINLPRGEREAYDAALAWHRAQHEDDAVRELTRIGPPPWQTLEDLLTDRRLAGIGPRPELNMDMAKVLASGGYSAPDPKAPETQMAIVGQMYRELQAVNLEPRLPRARTPLLLMVSGRDGIVLASSLRPAFDVYGGPKEWYLFEDSGHLPFIDATERFLSAVVAFLRKP